MYDRVLYFPYINVPSNEWFTRVLLYWDQVGSITPSEILNEKKETYLSQYMRDLIDTGLLIPVMPGAYIGGIPKFRDAFLNMIRKNPSISDRRDMTFEYQNTIRIHMEKIFPLSDDLCEMGLAREDEYPWYRVEKTTANLFMAYLASVLGKLDELKMDRITDQVEYMSVYSYSPQKTQEVSTLLNQLRVTALTGILPAPAGGIDVHQLADFKEAYSDSLSHFRRDVESALIDIAQIQDQDLRDRKIHHYRQKLEEDVNEVKALMRERRWPRIVLGSLCGFLVKSIPAAGAAAATGDLRALLSAVPPLVKAIYEAYQGEKKHLDEVKKSPLAYAAVAQEKIV